MRVTIVNGRETVSAQCHQENSRPLPFLFSLLEWSPY